jgi:hypothetical protein
MREDRVVRNEAISRELNERAREIEQTLTARGVVEPVELAEYFCECGLEGCTGKIRLTSEEYEQVRASPLHFAILPEHEVDEVERVISRTERFTVVEKFEGERELVLSDPRR